MYKYIFLISLFLCISSVQAQSTEDHKKLVAMFKPDVLKLDFPKGLDLSAMALITSKNGYYKLYFDDNIDTTLSIPQLNTQINSLDLFNQYLKKFNLKYKFERDDILRIYKDENYRSTTPYSVSSMFFVGHEKYGCYEKTTAIIDKFNMKLSSQDSADRGINRYGLNALLLNAAFNKMRINFNCIMQDSGPEFLQLTVTGFNYPEIMDLSLLLEDEIQKIQLPDQHSK